MTQFTKPHIDISSRRIARPYQAPKEYRGGGGAPRIREEHGRLLLGQLGSAFAGADAQRPQDPRIEPASGVYLEVELRRNEKPDKLERKSDGVRPGAVKVEDNETRTVALFVPDEARPVLERILEDYTNGPLTPRAGKPKNKDFVEPIESFRQARLETFWTDDPAALPANPQDVIWWEVWCFRGAEEKLEDVAQRLGARTAESSYRLTFPETTVIPILANRVTIELMLFATAGIAELRRASSTPTVFLDSNRDDQIGWAENLAGRITWPGADAPAVCLLDTGVNRAHMLIEPALAPNDATSVRAEWSPDDSHSEGHGTRMAGLALHGDLVPKLSDDGAHVLRHRLESVKVLPPAGFDPNDPKSYGAITQAAVALPEIERPERSRVFCMAVTNDNVSGSRSTTWSAAIDQIAAAAMPGDDEGSPRRLFIISAGNAPPHIERERILPADDYQIEDPAQAWNALTVGGHTDKILIDEPDLHGWAPFASAGDLSPFTRTSVHWPQSKSPFKPDIVMEAGNRAVSPNGSQVLSVDSLSLLTTGHDVDRHPLSPFQATSAATAQAARLAAHLGAEYPALWPEMIRALIVHSAEWTPNMRAAIDEAGGRRAAYLLLRKFGYGVPSLERALRSAQNHVAVFAQAEIQPFASQDGRRFRDAHYYRLPWPRALLEELGERDVRLKLTLSYFIEPNPGVSASIDPQRYQSFGLRFDLRRSLESVTQFVERVNALERDDPLGRVQVVADDDCWTFGPKSISAGSLHCDEWIGPAVKLASRDIICIKPVIGWWRNRAAPAICNKKTRYALIATLSCADSTIDLHTPISTLVETAFEVDIPF